MKTTANPLKQYRLAYGIQLQELAAKLSTTSPTIHKWENNRVPAHRVLDVEAVTGISRHRLRPDVFGPAAKAETAA